MENKNTHANQAAPDGKSLRTARIAVQVTPDEKREIEQAVAKFGGKASAWLRSLALRAIRED